jgi:uncharacterized membrane protein YcaP (DUF421 family)
MEFLREFWGEAIAIGAGDLGHVFLRSLVVVVFAIFCFLGERSVAQLDILGLLLLIGLGSALLEVNGQASVIRWPEGGAHS